MSAKTKPTLYESQREVAALREHLAERDVEIERLKAPRGVVAHPTIPAGLQPLLPLKPSGEIADWPTFEHDACAEFRARAEKAEAALAAAEARELKLREALSLAQRWLSNCVPVVKIDGPTPLPVIAAALSATTDTAALEALCLRVAEVAWRSRDEAAPGFIGDAEPNARAIVKRLLSGETGEKT